MIDDQASDNILRDSTSSQPRHAPEEHPRLRRVPLCEPIKMLLHEPLEDVALSAVEFRDGERMLFEVVITPGVEESKGDCLCEGWCLQARNCRLSCTIALSLHAKQACERL